MLNINTGKASYASTFLDTQMWGAWGLGPSGPRRKSGTVQLLFFTVIVLHAHNMTAAYSSTLTSR